MATQFYDRLSNDLTQLLESGINSDVSIEVNEEEVPLVNIYKVHSIILQFRSPYFKKKCDEITFNENHVKVLKLPNISVKVFNVIIKYIYSGKISLEKLENSIIFDLLIASNELELDELVEHLQSHFVNNNASWLYLHAKLFWGPEIVNEEEVPLVNIYKVHSIILQFRSPYFKKKCDEITFNENHVKVLKLPNISVKVFNVIIKYIYSGKISLEKLENSIIFDLLIASNELELDELVEHLQSHFVNNNASCRNTSKIQNQFWEHVYSWLRLNFAQVYRTSYQVKNFIIIQDFCNDVITKYPNTIFESENFHSLPEDALVSILKQDDLQLEESKIWEYVIEWGKAKNPMLPNNLDKWTSDNFLSLKKELKGCLPYIRFFSFSNEDVVEKIYPYQQLLEHQLFSDITIKFIAPNKPISSTVLPPRNILNTTLPTRITPIPNEYALMGSRDGFDIKTIYNICDKVSKIIIILKVNGTGEILGGYNPLERHTIENFPRSLEFCFGSALRLIGNLKTEKRCCKKIADYCKPWEIESRFSVEEYEVFKISPKK
ncbi:hypothetical protein Glove_109g380 [Diversispora epigaea]|uniref:BTB domain-containing protein n=1 Tax=Diversispora epigaea TaxID=1348612 RepID=A0A397J517_9GLOM|nr:hypothetical protein Glove_109g380 [Diversispora epigaea]